MTYTVRTADLGGNLRLPYADQGEPSGLPLVLVHGFGDSHRSFDLVLEHLPASIHVVAPTQRGHGVAARPPTGYGLPDLAADLLAFMDSVGLDQAVIAGHSMGSAVALRFAIDHPERTAGLVLAGAASGMKGTPAAREFWETTVSKLTDPVDPGIVRVMTEVILAAPVPREFVETMTGEGAKVPAFVWKAVFESRWRLEGDFSDQLGQVKAPVLVVWGDRDARYPRSQQDELLSAIPDSRLVVYPGAGHLLHWEEPERFAADLTAFVEELHPRE